MEELLLLLRSSAYILPSDAKLAALDLMVGPGIGTDRAYGLPHNGCKEQSHDEVLGISTDCVIGIQKEMQHLRYCTAF